MFTPSLVKQCLFALFFVCILAACSNDDTYHIQSPIQAIPVLVDDTVLFSNEDAIFAIDLVNGSEKFRLNPQAGVTTALSINSGSLYYGDENGDICAVNLESKIQTWCFDTKISIYSQPIIDDDNLYFGNSDDIFALNKLNGTRLWDFSLPKDDEFYRGVSYSAAYADESSIYIGTEEGVLYALNKLTGEKSWTFDTDDGIEYTTDQITSSVTKIDDLVYITEVKFLLHALESGTGEKRWTYKAKYPNLSSPVSDGEKLYFSTWASGNFVGESTNGELYAVNASTGELAWSLDLDIGFSTAPTIDNNTIFVGSWDGKMHAINADSGELVWSYDAGNILPGKAVVAGGKVLFASFYCLEGTCTGSGEINNHANTLIMLDSQNGEKLWQFTASR